MKWVLISIGISAIGFAILKSKSYQPHHMVFPAGWHNVVVGWRGSFLVILVF